MAPDVRLHLAEGVGHSSVLLVGLVAVEDALAGRPLADLLRGREQPLCCPLGGALRRVHHVVKINYKVSGLVCQFKA